MFWFNNKNKKKNKWEKESKLKTEMHIQMQKGKTVFDQSTGATLQKSEQKEKHICNIHQSPRCLF